MASPRPSTASPSNIGSPMSGIEVTGLSMEGNYPDRISSQPPPPPPPEDSQFWLDESRTLPNAALLRRHFHKEGRLKHHQAIWLIERGTALLSSEPNVLNVEAPVTMVGDIHGQYYDLMTLLKPTIGGSMSSTRYLFLGDYVDRGYFGIECLLFLFALKITHPTNYYFLRGNHESQHLTDYFTFRLECQKKYSKELWHACLRSFQAMPLAAVVNNEFFCVHGGLSPSMATIADLQAINRFQEPGSNGILCDILWSDPVDPEKNPLITHYEPNPVRGCSYYFGWAAVEEFLQRNNLKMVIRAHEAQQQGFKRFAREGMPPYLMTIFSAPNYLDHYGNMGAVLRYDGKTMTIRQFQHVDHPFWLPGFQDVFSWSLPFVADRATDIIKVLLDLIDIDTETDSDDEDLVTPPMPGVALPVPIIPIVSTPTSSPRRFTPGQLPPGDPNAVIGVSRDSAPKRKKKINAPGVQYLSATSRMAAVYRLLRDETEGASELQAGGISEEALTNPYLGSMLAGGGLVNDWSGSFDKVRELDLINEHVPPNLIEPGEPRPPIIPLPETASPESAPHELPGSGPHTPSYSGNFSPTTAINRSAYLNPKPMRGTFIGTTHSSNPSMRRRTLEEMDVLLKGVVKDMESVSIKDAFAKR